MLLTKDLLQTWLLDHIEKDNHKDIMAYLEGFIQRNASALQNQWIALVPYDNYTTEYKESCKNTREANENNIPTKIIYEERQEYDFHYIGKYYSKSGKEYDVAEVRIEGNTYIFAKNVSEDKDTYRTEEWIDITLVNYYLSRGKEVVEDQNSIKQTNQTAPDVTKKINIPQQKIVNSFQQSKTNTIPKWFVPWVKKR